MMSRRDKNVKNERKDKNSNNDIINEKEQRRKNFVIARIEEEETEERILDVIVSPYRGTRNFDNKLNNDVSLQSDKKDKVENTNINTNTNVVVNSGQDNKVIDKYSPDRIPSYLRSEGGGITKKNLAALRGDKADPKEELEKNRRIFGRNYQMFLGEEKDTQTPNNNGNYETPKDIYFEEKIDTNQNDIQNNNQEYKYDTNNIDDKDINFNHYTDSDNTNNNYADNNYNGTGFDNDNIDLDSDIYYSDNTSKNTNYEDTNYEDKDIEFNHSDFETAKYAPEIIIDQPKKAEENYFNQNHSNVDNKTKVNDLTNNDFESETKDYDKPKVIDIPKEYNYKKSKQRKYVFPPLELLNQNGLSKSNGTNEIQYQISAINKVFEDFRIGARVCNYTKGPTVTQFEIKVDPGVNVKKVLSVNRNLQMELQSSSIRIEAPIPGKSTIGIEAPNINNDIVLFGDLLACDLEESKLSGKPRNKGKPLDIILGVSIDGRHMHTDIAKMPHGLIAGTSGSGKTVCIYSIIFSLIYKSTPDELKMILIDPKRNELMFFEQIPHLATPIIDDPKLATATIKWCTDEMERRYEFLRSQRKRDIEVYNEYAKANGLKPIPYLVIIIDEFADLITMAGDSFEDNVKRLTAKARSAGIHLLIATQRPSTDIIKGTIKANIQCRIAFSVKNFVDSQTIIDHGGAENLIGKGDMLLCEGKKETRIQGGFVGQDELEKLSEYFYQQDYEPNYMFTHEDIRKQVEQQENQPSDPVFDPRFEEIARFVFRQRKASANQIQTTFEIGFNRANKIIIALAQLGIVTSENIPGKAREVIISDPEELERILSQLN